MTMTYSMVTKSQITVHKNTNTHYAKMIYHSQPVIERPINCTSAEENSHSDTDKTQKLQPETSVKIGPWDLC